MQKLGEAVFFIKIPVSIFVSIGSQNNFGTCSLGHLSNSAVNPGYFVPCNTKRERGGALSPRSVFAKLNKLENSNLAR